MLWLLWSMLLLVVGVVVVVVQVVEVLFVRANKEGRSWVMPLVRRVMGFAVLLLDAGVVVCSILLVEFIRTALALAMDGTGTAAAVVAAATVSEEA